MLLRTTDNRRKPDNPSRALACEAWSIPFAILLLSVMLCPGAGAFAQPTERAPDTIEARLLACTPCHGLHGEGTKNDYFPRLAGKPAGYLMNQLVAFSRRAATLPPDELPARISIGLLFAKDSGVFRRVASAAGTECGDRC
jgi:hypothetical protein